MMNHLRILFLSILLPVLAEAQISGRGKIITVQGDTVNCIIEIQQKQFGEVIKYKKNKEDRFEKFPMAYLHKIIFKDKEYEKLFFVKEAVDGKIYTCKLCLCVIKGHVKLYKESATMFYNGAEVTIDKNMVKAVNRDRYFIVKGNGNAEEVNPTGFVKQSKKIFSECNNIVDSINQNKYNFDDIMQIVSVYNDFYTMNEQLLTQK